MPHIIVIAGANGAGKSTVAPYLLRDKLGVSEFVNADTLAQGLSAYSPEKVAISAGRVRLIAEGNLLKIEKVRDERLWQELKEKYGKES